MRLSECESISQIIQVSHLADYELEVGAIANEVTHFNANLYLMEKLFNFPWGLILDDWGPFWEYVEKALFDSVILSIWKLCIDQDAEGLTLGRLRNKIITVYINPEFKDEFREMLRSADYDAKLSETKDLHNEVRNNYVAHFNIRKATKPTPEEIAARDVDLQELLQTRDLINAMYKVLSFDRYAYLPVQYYPDSLALGGEPPETDIDRFLDLIAQKSTAVNMPEQQPEFWGHYKEALPKEHLSILLDFRKKFGLPAA